NFRFTEKEEALRKEIREFVKQEIPPEHSGGTFEEEHSDEAWAFSMSISKKLAQKGWLTMSWPKEYGGMGASEWEQLVYSEEVGYWGIPGTGMGVSGVGWVGPSLILFGTEEQKKKYMPRIASGEPDGVWCTGYSEPDAGSDFANLRTRAERKGDEYIINGQKVWTSAGHRARWCWLAARTDTNVQKKHHGISIIIVDMKSEGVTIRPIRNYAGLHFFNEIFFEDVRVPVENLVGVENRGWYQLMQSLGFERGGVAIGAYGSSKRTLDELMVFAKETGLIKKPDVRQKLADVAVDLEVLRMLAYETIWKMSKGITVTYEPSRDKCYNDVFSRKLYITATEILGAYSQLEILDENTAKWARLKGRIEKGYCMFPGIATAGGTTDTQRNIVGQFALGHPRSY
ncbi:MAG: acyl-CoA dehydrogenase family protein, partial [Thermodesulfobacteriota bacterium]|nr:acyl-CoA dehydrogenase family protein [Thermodesulfobacteriota bacterium]